MKKILLAVLFSVTSLGIYAQETDEPIVMPKTASDVSKFDSELIDMGKIKQGTPTNAKFTVTNISTTPLIIETASPTCGCTISDFTKTPILPNQKGIINATYNAAAPGIFNKQLSVKFAGINDSKPIKITGEVLDAIAFDKYQAENSKKPAATTVITVDKKATAGVKKGKTTPKKK